MLLIDIVRKKMLCNDEFIVRTIVFNLFVHWLSDGNAASLNFGITIKSDPT